MVVLVGIYTLHSLILSEIVLNQKFKDLSVDWDLRKSYEDAASDFRDSDLVEPRMLSDISNLEPCFRVSVEDL
jgi:hypothetical protein